MIETVINTALWPNTNRFNLTVNNPPEVMRITRDGVLLNPDISIDDTVKSVLAALDSQIKLLIKSAVEEKREWIGLTDEQIHDIVYAQMGDQHPAVGFRVAHCIEAKLKEKNT